MHSIHKAWLIALAILAGNVVAQPKLDPVLNKRFGAAIVAGKYDEAMIWGNHDLNLASVPNPDTITPLEALGILESQQRGRDSFSAYLHLPYLARVAFAAGDLVKAEQYARQLLAESQHYFKSQSGDATYYGNQVLGRVLLRRGDMAGADACLLESGKSIGTPVLNSFGPNMLFAQELLRAGQRDVVLKFLDECAEGFWKRGADKISKMKSEILTSGTASFEHLERLLVL